ncbi:L-threonine O-3-phosphate decarboxylase [Bosea sp. BK604]|nr:L-threonine O-3-phosphate decarboxylase [Bosea sp. BK604]
MVEGEVWHGGDLATAKALFPEAPEPWIDLSTGINPIPYPVPALPLSLWQRLPGKAEEAALLEAARKAYRVAAGAGLVAAPGTQILIEALPRIAGEGPVAVLGPTYAEHALSWRKAGASVREIATPDDAGDAPVVVLVNPNNPDGRVIGREALASLARRLAERGGLLIIDEAFVDFTPRDSLIPELPPSTLVLRSFGKTYGLAGLRLGFAVAEPRLTDALRTALGPWSVAGPALHVGALALADRAWLDAAARARAADAIRLDTLLAPHGRIVGGTALYRLLATPDASALFAHLGRNGIYARRFQNDASWLRFGLPGDEPAWVRLGEALASFVPARHGAA